MKNRITTMMLMLFCSSINIFAQSENVAPSGFPELDEWVKQCKVERPNALGYPGNYDSKLDSPYVLFITTREVYDNQNSFDVAYLNAKMRMINCSRSGVEPLKFWWLLRTVGIEGWTEQATAIMENTAYLVSELTRIG